MRELRRKLTLSFVFCSGQISLSSLSMRYREGLPLVLKGVSLDISAGERVGIVGRTGSGKSSLTLSIFR